MELRNKVFLGALSSVLVGGAMLWEGVSYKPYVDIAGVLTVCHGYTGGDITQRTYTAEECRTLLEKELYTHSKKILECINVPLTQNEFDAYSLFAYNVGVKGFCSSSALRLLNQDKRKEACNAIAYTPNGNPNWSYVNGKFVQGLHNRRKYERNICLSGSYKFS